MFPSSRSFCDTLRSTGDAISDTLRSTGVHIPKDLVGDHDDTDMYFTPMGKLVMEHPCVENTNREIHIHCVKLALEYYNHKHQSDYKALIRPLYRFHCLGLKVEENGDRFFHTSFEAVSGDSTFKMFCTSINFAERVFSPQWKPDMKPEVAHCEIADGTNSNACKHCNRIGASYPPQDSTIVFGPPSLSEYSEILADDGAALSEKAKHRLEYSVPALKYYNHTNGEDYKLVDALPHCFGNTEDTLDVVHCNFIAKKNGESKNTLFFAEIHRTDSEAPLVTYCRSVSGKTKTGCHICSPVMGKRVIHPLRGYPCLVKPNPKLRLTGPCLRSSNKLRLNGPCLRSSGKLRLTGPRLRSSGAP